MVPELYGTYFLNRPGFDLLGPCVITAQPIEFKPGRRVEDGRPLSTSFRFFRIIFGFRDREGESPIGPTPGGGRYEKSWITRENDASNYLQITA